MKIPKFCLAGGLIFAITGSFAETHAPSDVEGEVSTEDIESWLEDLSNWGRWGADDQLGALNLITPEKRRTAAALVVDGISVSLARDVETLEAADNALPFKHTMLWTGAGEGTWSADNYNVSYHGFAHTHMDALCHIFHDGKMFNGYSRSEVDSSGARQLGIHHIKNGIFTRGILIDGPMLRGVDYLGPGEGIYPADIRAWEKQAGVQISSGDIVIIYTGRWKRRAAVGAWSVRDDGAAGVHASCVRLFRERDIAVLASDAASDVLPSGIPEFPFPVHLLMLNTMGVHIFDNLDLEALATECRERKRWEFLVTVAPLAVKGGTGSPFNPIATF